MNRFTSNASLVLHPENPDAVPDDIDHIITRLQQIGLTSDKLPGDEHCYLAGEHFLDLVAFMGCSPSISFSPGAGADPFSFIRLITTPDRITTFTGRFSHAPHCPHCNKPEKTGVTGSAIRACYVHPAT